MTIEEYFNFMKEWKKNYEKETEKNKPERIEELQKMLPEFEKLFWAIFEDIQREGVEKLRSFIEKSDFMNAPASTKYHSDFKGGLLIHTLNVYCCLYYKREEMVWKDILSPLSDEQLAVLALCHDFHKLYFYASDVRNKKVYSETGTKSDNNGRYDWVSVPFYTVDDKYPLGSGEKSVIFLMQFLKLSMKEIMMLRWHHGYAVSKDEYKLFEDAVKKYPEVLALHQADTEASELLEVII